MDLPEPPEPAAVTASQFAFARHLLRKKASLKRRALQQAIFNSVNFSSIATDDKGVIQIFNVGAERMLGYSASEVVDRITPADISDPDELIARAHSLSLEFGQPIQAGFQALVFKATHAIEDIDELTYIRRDGSRFPAVVSVTALRDVGDEIIGYLLIGTDNTARKRVEEILAHQVQERTADLQRFRTAMDATTDAIMLVQRGSMRFIEVNATACSMLGYSRDELFRISPAQLCVSTMTDIEAQFDAVIAGGTVIESKVIPLRRKDGSHLKVEIHLQAQRAAQDWIIVGVVTDVTERERSAERLHRLAHYDSVTGLPNRILFYQTLQTVLLQAAEKSWNVAVMCLDLDHFKNVNDTLGHASGDELLLQFSARLGGCVRAGDAVGRLGGDEFAMILVMHDGQAGAVVVANKIRDAMRAPYNLNGHEVAISGSIGIAVYPNDAQDSATLLKYADTALYQAKKAGRDTYRFFTAQMNLQVVARLALETALRHAVEHDEFVLRYQPKLDIDSGAIAGAEALLRWQRPGVGLVMPDAFMLTLEETGLIVAVGRWVIATACRQIAEWLTTPVGAVPISVNVSGRQFMEGDLYRDVITSIASSAIPAQLLELELTESALMDNTERTIACLANLKRRGVLISIDDFGTGYSSLAYLRRFPIDKLKIDMSFIRDVTSNPDAASIVLAIISMAHSLKLDVIAEGVETDAQLAYLRRHHCDEMQGHLFSPALPTAAMAALLVGGRGLPRPTSSSSIAQQAMLLVVNDNAQRLRLAGALRLDGVSLFCANSAARAFGLLAQHTVQVVVCVHGEEGLDAVDFFERVRRLYPNVLRLALSDSSNAQALAELVNRTGLHRLYPLCGETAALQRDLRDCFRTVMQPHNRRLGDDDAQTVIDDPVPEPA